MKIIENKYEDHVFPKQVKCEHCGSILELERDDCKDFYNAYTRWHIYTFTCPCCKKNTTFEELL